MAFFTHLRLIGKSIKFNIMTQLTKRRNGGLLPSLRNEILPHRFFTSDLFDFDDDFFSTGMVVPPANIIENKDHYKLDLSVPGMKRDDFKVDVEDGILTISSEKKEEREEDDKNYKRREFSYSSFSRSFTLSDNMDENNINAKYDNGMLQITIPKKEVTVSKPKKEISIE
jgi:HSP20 family protein